MMGQEKRKVLICDDSMFIRKKLRDLLETEVDCEVVVAGNGQEGITSYDQTRPEVVFMDIVMPVCDGLSALQEIKRLDQAANVVMLSSTGTSAKLVQALKLGANNFIQKPYDREQIAKAISSIHK